MDSKCVVFVLVGCRCLAEPFQLSIIVILLKQLKNPDISNVIYVHRSVLQFNNLFAKIHALIIEFLLYKAFLLTSQSLN